MARKVTAYACEWGCRRQTVTSRKSVEQHESKCYRNPERQACATCEHDFIEYPHVTRPGQLTVEEVQAMTVKGCMVGQREPGIKIAYDCPYWEPKSDEPWDDEPAWEI